MVGRLLLILVPLFSVSTAFPIFLRHDTERVPLARVIANLEGRLAADPRNPEYLYQLARVHSMAYATNLPTVEINKRDSKPVFAPPGSDSGVPEQVTPRATPQQQAVARAHLTNAIAFYDRAVTAVGSGTNAGAHQWLVIPIHLGLAWTLEQAGRKQDAIEAYRDALQHAWRKEVDPDIQLKKRGQWSWDQLRTGRKLLTNSQRRGYIGPGVCYSEEVIGYLLHLLDPKEDAKEIAQLKADRRILDTMPRAVTPILVPVSGAGAGALDQLIDPHARVVFDLDGTGNQRRWEWISTNAAWLVFDHDGGGKITSGLQLFGNVTFWVFWRNGYAALASLDDNGDGELRDEELRGLALWHDRNSNGISEPGEVNAAGDFGIMTIDCRHETHATGIEFNPRGLRLRDGSARPTYDWIVPSR